TVAGFDLDSGLAAKYGKEPTDWKQYYLSKNKSATSVEKSTAERAAAATEENADTQLIEQADQEYISARTQLESFQENGNVDILMQVASKMMWILDTFPTHAGCYYILGFILFVLNKLEEARILLQMGCGVDPDFEPF
ncbi:hypothetical protein BDF20DRAFT_802699, partial [Mycotypha africana]|uniref:uncharacterized protein n=1 Tax=Mycotypha africana TaxID=64632 RepID=UPI002301D4ED